jgi:hypothetical protein
MFTYFTDRDGKYQLLALAESGFDPLARTTRFMLTEEAHHMFVGETGIAARRRAHVRADEAGDQRGRDASSAASICPRSSARMNYWFSMSLDLFGGEISSNAAQYFAAGLKGRAHEEEVRRPQGARRQLRAMMVLEGRPLGSEAVPMRNAMNEVLRDDYIEDCQRGVDKWNKQAGRHAADPGRVGGSEVPVPHEPRRLGLCAERAGAGDRGGQVRQLHRAAPKKGIKGKPRRIRVRPARLNSAHGAGGPCRLRRPTARRLTTGRAGANIRVPRLP